MKASRDCTPVMSVGKLFNNLMEVGKNEHLYAFTLVKGTRNLVVFPLVCTPTGCKYVSDGIETRSCVILYNMVTLHC